MTPEEALADGLKARGFTFPNTEWAPEEALAAEALAVPCPVCSAAPGAPCGALGRVHAARLPAPKLARTRAAEIGGRILAELRGDGVTAGAEEDLAAVVGDLDGRPVTEIGRVLRTVARELATPDGLTGSTVAALMAALEARRS